MATKPKLPAVKGGKYTGQMSGEGGSEKFAHPTHEMTPPIEGMGGTQNDIGEKSGFQTSGYIDKKGTPYGEAAKFNAMPPGSDIDEQAVADIRPMPFKKLVDESYPGDGW
jgi:hypothetical protein